MLNRRHLPGHANARSTTHLRGSTSKLMVGSWALDDLQGPSDECPDPIYQLSCVTGVGPDQLEPRETSHQFADDQFRPLPVLDVSRVDHNGQQQPNRVYGGRLRPITLLASVIATRAPFPVVLTVWLSMMVAPGVASLSFGLPNAGPQGIVDSFPCAVSRPPLEILVRRLPGPEVVWHHSPSTPGRRTYKMPLITSRTSTVRSLPPGLATRSRGASTFHWSSVRSLAYGLPFMPHSLI